MKPTVEGRVEGGMEGGMGMFMGDPSRSGASPYDGADSNDVAAYPTIDWHVKTGSRIFASPVFVPSSTDDVRQGRLYVGSLDGTFLALNLNGETLWRFSGEHKFYSTAAVDRTGKTGEQSVYVGDHGGNLYSFSTDGSLRWQRTLPGPIDAPILLDGQGNVYVLSDGLHRFSREGVHQFHAPIEGELPGAPAWHPLGFVVFGTVAGELIAVNPDGMVRFRTPTGSSISGGVSVDAHNRMYVGTARGELQVYGSNGVLLWSFATGGEIRATPSLLEDGTAVVGSYDGHVYAVAQDGTLRWKSKRLGRIRSSARIGKGGTLFVGSQDDHVYALRSSDGFIVWRIHVGHDVDSTATLGPLNDVYFGSDSGHIYRVVTHRPTAGDGTTGVPGMNRTGSTSP